MNDFSTKLAQILLTHRPTDYLLLISDKMEKTLGMCWGRKFTQIMHLDRLFIFPQDRNNGIATLVIVFFVYHFNQILWRAVHEAMDKIAKNLNGYQDTIDGYRGWVITKKNLKNDNIIKLRSIKTSLICEKCELETPIGNYCVFCGSKFSEAGLKR